jgi:hypothetical protein
MGKRSDEMEHRQIFVEGWQKGVPSRKIHLEIMSKFAIMVLTGLIVCLYDACLFEQHGSRHYPAEFMAAV